MRYRLKGFLLTLIRSLRNIAIPVGKAVYVPLQPTKDGTLKTSSSSQWTLDLQELEVAFAPRAKTLIINKPHNPVRKIFSKSLQLSEPYA